LKKEELETLGKSDQLDPRVFGVTATTDQKKKKKKGDTT